MLKGLSLCIAASGAYAISSHRSGNLGTAPVRTSDYVMYQMESSEAVKSMRKHREYLETSSKLAFSRLQRDGAVSESIISFQSTDKPKHLVSFVYCGPRSVGFPHMVHGGVIASLMQQTAETAMPALRNAKFEIKYLKPTKIDQILRIETDEVNGGVDVRMFTADGKIPLVEAKYTT